MDDPHHGSSTPLLRGDAPNLVPLGLGEPQVAIRPRGDAQRLAAKFVPTPRGQGEHGIVATGGETLDAIPKGQGEPQIAIGPGRDAERPAKGNGELGDKARSGDAPNLVDIEFCEPEVAIRPDRDALRQAARCGDEEFGDAATGSETPDDVGPSGEPQIAIRPGGDAERVAAARGDIELGDSAGCGPGGSAAQAQQADTGNYSCEKCSQVRPPFSTVHIASSFR